MKYTNLFSEQHTPALVNPHLFNGDKEENSRVIKYVKSQTPYGGESFVDTLWSVNVISPKHYLVVIVNSITKLMWAVVAVASPRSCDELHGTEVILANLRKSGNAALADNLQQAQIVNQYGVPSTDAGLKEENMRYSNISETSDQTQVQSDANAVAPELEEAYRKGWAILPATVALYNKKVVDIITAASEWSDMATTILVCSKYENDRNRLLFIASAGDAFNSYHVGQSSETFHDQTRASKGVYTIENIVLIKNSEIIKKVNSIGLDKKCSLAVFK